MLGAGPAMRVTDGNAADAESLYARPGVYIGYCHYSLK